MVSLWAEDCTFTNNGTLFSGNDAVRTFFLGSGSWTHQLVLLRHGGRAGRIRRFADIERPLAPRGERGRARGNLPSTRGGRGFSPRLSSAHSHFAPARHPRRSGLHSENAARSRSCRSSTLPQNRNCSNGCRRPVGWETNFSTPGQPLRRGARALPHDAGRILRSSRRDGACAVPSGRGNDVGRRRQGPTIVARQVPAAPCPHSDRAL